MRLIEQSSASNTQSQDKASGTVLSVPLGLPWFKALSSEHTQAGSRLKFILYTQYETMMSHHSQCQASNQWQKNWVLLHADLPPHAVKALWDAVYDHQYQLVLMTADRFIASIEKNKFLYEALLDHLVVAEAQYLPLQKHSQLCEGLIRQPHLTLLVTDITPTLLKQFETVYQRPFENRVIAGFSQAKHIFDVVRCFTQYQKLKALRYFLNHETKPDNVTILICDSEIQMKRIKAQLNIAQTVICFSDLSHSEDDCFQNVLILCLSKQLNVLPATQWSPSQLNMIYWTCPTEISQLSKAVATHADVEQIHTLVLYTKEDYLEKRQILARQLNHSVTQKAEALSNLHHIRQACIQRQYCYLSYLKNTLGTSDFNPTHAPCGACHACRYPLRKTAYTQWLNLVTRLLF